jgi:hypothetical protein
VSIEMARVLSLLTMRAKWEFTAELTEADFGHAFACLDTQVVCAQECTALVGRAVFAARP